MDRKTIIAEQVAKLPPALKQVLDAALAAGNVLEDVEFGRGKDEGKIALIVDHPFRIDPKNAPDGVLYREFKDHDPMIFEYYTAEETFSLVTGKLKPIILEKLGPGPTSPNESHTAFMKQYTEEMDKAAAARKAANNKIFAPNLRVQNSPLPSDAVAKFISSMTMTFDMWHDGLGYDLDALKGLSKSDLEYVVTTLINHQPRDWRDIEALAQIDSPRARKEVEAALKSSDPQVRQTAMDYAGEKDDPKDRERLLIKSLRNDVIFGGLSQAIDEVPDFHPPAVIEELFKGALNRDGEVAVHFAALLYFLHGKAKEPFDWDHRPFFLRFNTSDRNERKAVFRELCETVGVDSKKYLR